MKKEQKAKFIEVKGLYGDSQLINLDRVQNIRSTIDEKSGKQIIFIYFDGPGAYVKTSDTLEDIKEKIKEINRK